MTHLSKKEWEQLDNLLGKHGFGGYYDLVECLKMVLTRLAPNNAKVLRSVQSDLPTIVKTLLAVTRERR